MSGIKSEAIAEAVLAHVSPEPNSGCWLWTGTINDSGYGRFNVSDRRERAHRLLYEYLKGPIPEGLILDHLCRVRSCVNPDHLEPVTQGENVRRGMAGATQRARQLAKTHCPHGHDYTPENTSYNWRGARVCRACRNAQQRRYRARKCQG